MIERLRQAQSSVDPVEARASELLQSVEPTEESLLLKRKVWLAVAYEPRNVSRSWLLARPALAAALVVCLSAAAAGATIGRGFITRVVTALASVSISEPPPAAPPNLKASRTLAPRDARPTNAEPAPPSPDPPPPSAEVPARAPSRPARAPTRPTAKRSSVAADAFAAAPREEASLVLGAMTALRRDRDPARATRMLSEYLRSYPRGTLREEALALQMEAASSLGDPQLGARVAQGYLRSHPNGRFRDLAKNALDRSPSGEAKP